MMKKHMSWLLVLVLIMGSLAGCSQAPAQPAAEPAEVETEAPAEETAPAEEAMEEVAQTLIWNLGSEPKTLDPGLNTAIDGGDIINHLFEGLLREVDGMLEPGMAESYSVSDDKLTYTFKLRDAQWSDGKPVTAHDFEYAWARVIDPETASEYSWIFNEANIDSFKAVDEMTFEVTLTVPSPYFLGLTAFFTFMPVRQDAVEAGADGMWAMDPTLSIVNGPFLLDSYASGDKLVLKKNSGYWRADQVVLEQIDALMIVDQSTALTGYDSGQIDVIDDMPTAEIPRLLAEDPTFMILPYDGVYYYILNTKIEPLDNVEIRRALSLAIDRTAIVETVLKGGQLPAKNMVSQASRDANGDVFADVAGSFGVPMDASGVEEAKQILADAGYPDGEGFPEFTILYNTSESHKAVAEAIQEMWNKNLGINVQLANQEWAVFQDTRRQHSFDIARGGWIGDYSDPMTYLGMFLDGASMNHAQWSNPEYDALIKAASVQDGQERFDTLQSALSLVMEGRGYMPIYYYTDQIMVSTDVANWEKTTRGNWWFGFAEKVN